MDSVGMQRKSVRVNDIGYESAVEAPLGKIMSRINSLEKKASFLHSKAEILERKITHVLTSSIPTKSGQSPAKTLDDSHLATRLDALFDQIACTEELLDSIIDRADI